MSTGTQTARAKLVAATTQVVYNLVSPATPLEAFSQALPSGSKSLLIRSRGTGVVRFTTVAGEIGSKYVTIPGGATYSKDNLDLTGKTLYLACDKGEHTIEVEVWN